MWVQSDTSGSPTKFKKFCEAQVWSMKVKAELCWRCQDVRRARDMDKYQGEMDTGAEAAREWAKCSTAEQAEPSKSFDIREHRALGFRIFLAAFPRD